jgi:hypothetical protein
MFHVDAYVVGHLGPPVVAGYELEGLEAACMSYAYERMDAKQL